MVGLVSEIVEDDRLEAAAAPYVEAMLAAVAARRCGCPRNA